MKCFGWGLRIEELELRYALSGWTHPVNPLNVDNNSGVIEVAPLDALLVVNELTERRYSDPLSGILRPAAATAPPPYLDVDGDGKAAPVDALLVINALDNSTPHVDLNGSVAGVNSTAVFTEDGPAVALGPQTVVTDADNAYLEFARITLVNPQDGDLERLVVDTTGTQVISSWDPLAGQLLLEQVDTKQNYQQVLRTLVYSNSSQDPDTSDRTVQIVLSDGKGQSDPVRAVISMVAVNDPPLALPVNEQQILVGTELLVNLFAVDPDASDILTFVLDTPSPSSATIEPVDTRTARIRWTPSASDIGMADFAVVVRDNGQPGLSAEIRFSVAVNPIPVSIEITSLPSYGQSGFARGFVSGLDPEEYRIAPYIQVEGLGWYTKPTFAQPTVSIQWDGTFSARIVTGGLDDHATIVCVAAIPQDVSPPVASGTAELPLGLADIAVAMACEERYARTLEFAELTWAVKRALSPVGPGQNLFSAQESDVWVDSEGLHLTIQQHGGKWYATEVMLLEPLGYGTYSFQTSSRLDNLDPNVTAGYFTWDPYGGERTNQWPNREIDFEDSLWGDAANPHNTQMVVQPFSVPGNLNSYSIPDQSGDASRTRWFTWTPDRIEFVDLQGFHTPTDYDSADLIERFEYVTDPSRGHFVPSAGNARFRFNLWLNNIELGGPAPPRPANGQPVELVISDFDFTPLPASAMQEPGHEIVPAPDGWAAQRLSAVLITGSADHLLAARLSEIREPFFGHRQADAMAHMLSGPLPEGRKELRSNSACVDYRASQLGCRASHSRAAHDSEFFGEETEQSLDDTSATLRHRPLQDESW